MVINNMNNQNDKSGQHVSSPERNGTSASEDTSQVLRNEWTSEDLQLILNKDVPENELVEAISKCRDLIVENSEPTTERKWLVRNLIELRLKLYQEFKDASADPQHPRNKATGLTNKTVKGHHLKLQPFLNTTSHPYCDHCTGAIWSVVQAWYMCEDCGYSCHYKCLTSIIRECAHIIACEKGQYELQICPEKGLPAQKYLCAECNMPLASNNGTLDTRQCDYNGLFYCFDCHWNSTALIPARIIQNWDFEPRPVSQASLQLLQVTVDRPLINLDQLSPGLFSKIQELQLVRTLRQELHGIRKYLVLCRKARQEHLLWKCNKPYIFETVKMYSMQDLIDTQTGDLSIKLQNLIDLYTRHIKIDCEICKGRGHICEICKNDDVLYPFVISAQVCKDCNAVFHKRCLERVKSECPRCIRIRKRKESEEEANNNL